MPEIAWVNGTFLPLANAMVHVEDRGFQYADSVYEVLRTYRGRPFAVDEHLARFASSLAAIRLEYAVDQLRPIIAEAVTRAGFAEAIIYIQITRGVAARRRDFPVPVKPTVVLTVRELHPMDRAARERGIAVLTVPDNRWGRCDIKTVALLANVLAYNDAVQRGAQDAVFIAADDTVNEATAGNIFIVTHGTLRTPPKGPQLLAGVTRDKILAAARAAAVPVREERFTRSELRTADEVFLTSTTTEVLPVTRVDGQVIGTGRQGSLTRQLHEEFHRRFVGD